MTTPLRFHRFPSPRPCRHEVAPATPTHPGCGIGPTHAYLLDLITGHVYVGSDEHNLTKVCPENLYFPGPPPPIFASVRADKKPRQEKETKPRKKSQKTLLIERAMELLKDL